MQSMLILCVTNKALIQIKPISFAITLCKCCNINRGEGKKIRTILCRIIFAVQISSSADFLSNKTIHLLYHAVQNLKYFWQPSGHAATQERCSLDHGEISPRSGHTGLSASPRLLENAVGSHTWSKKRKICVITPVTQTEDGFVAPPQGH